MSSKHFPVTSALVALSLGMASSTWAQPSTGPDTVARLVGVPLGASAQQVLAAARVARAACSSPRADAIVCSRSLGAQSVPATATFWLREGRVQRVYEVVQETSPRFSDYAAWNHSLKVRAERTLGAAPARSSDLPPGWIRDHTDAERLAAVAAGNVGMETEWKVAGARVSVSLRGENGRVILVSAVERETPAAAAAQCSSDAVASALMDLFPPATVEARTAAARRLASCRQPRSSGALGAALGQDQDESVRAELARALGAVSVPTVAESQAPPVQAVPEKTSAPPTAAPVEAPIRIVAAPVAALALVPVPPPSPPPPAPSKPRGPADGTPLAITTSIAAGGLWGGALSLLAQQNSVGVVTLVGSAGAVIGGGTAWGLTKFGVRPSPSQAMWFTNATTWGTLAGLMAWSGSGSVSPKLKYGFLIGGETVGVAAGVWGARNWAWTPGQVVLANSLVLGAGLSTMGVGGLRHPEGPVNISPAVGYGTAPAMVLAAIASRYVRPTADDLRLMGLSALAGGWTGGLFASGLAGKSLLADGTGQGGLMLGMGLGYLGAATASPFVEVTQQRLAATAGGILAGNTFGLGVHMIASPGGSNQWNLGAALGGAGLGMAAFAAAPYVHPGPQAVPMSLAGALYGSGVWTLALKAASTGQPPDARVPGGMLVGGVSAGIAGLLASQRFAPDAHDQVETATATALGMSAGLGIAKLATPEKGLPDFIGVVAGAAGGFAAGAVLAHGPRLQDPAIAAGALGGSYGLLIGALVPTLHLGEWNDGRKTAGGTWLGLGAGAVGGTLLARAVDPSGAQVRVVTVAGVAGLGMGLGAGALWPSEGSQSMRIGTVAGSAGLALAAGLLEPKLHLADGLGPEWGSMAGWGLGLGYLEGALAASVVESRTGDLYGYSSLAQRQSSGGKLFGATAGAVTGMVMSKWTRPGTNDYAATVSASILGLALGHGASRLMLDDDGLDYDRRAPGLRLGGSMLGLAAGAASAHLVDWRREDMHAGLIGVAYGGLLGTLIPSLHEPRWDDGSRGEGGFSSGLALGGMGAAVAAHASDATDRQVGTVAIAGGLGLTAGLGLGMMLPTESLQPARIGTVAGTAAFVGGAILAEHPLRLNEGFSTPGAPEMFLSGGILGAAHGLMLAGILDNSGLIAGTPERQGWGGTFLGTSLGGTSGLILSRFTRADGADHMAVFGGSAIGGTLGLGTAMLVTSTSGRPDTAAAMAGSVAGMAAAAITQHVAPVQPDDAVAMPVGIGFGALLGSLAPNLGNQTWPGWNRQNQGSLLVGMSGGALSAMALRRATGATREQIGLATLGGLDGLTTGLGVGLLIDSDSSSQARRIGVAAGSAAGLGIGAALWPRLTLGPTDRSFIAGVTVLGAWNGLWIPALGHAHSESIGQQKLFGGLLAGAGGASLLATALVPKLEVDEDLMINAASMDALLSAAGAGAGALASERADAPVWGLLGGGAAGLVLGGAAHRAINIEEKNRPLLTLAPIEGLWLGAWLPHMIYKSDGVGSRQQLGGMAAGTLGATAIAVMASPWFVPDAGDAAMAGVGSAVGASIAGGAVMLSQDLNARAAVGVMLGGSALGLGVGALVAPQLDGQDGLVQPAMLGATLGASEGLVFAWAGRARTSSDYAAGALIGAGLGTSLGLASATRPSTETNKNLASMGFAAWGAWMGSFSGALLNRDPHEVTLGGAAGANLGYLAGYGLLSTGLVEPRDFGWLSLAGASGTVAGGVLGAVLSSADNSRPVLAGLALGPVVGMAGGALILPRLRALSQGSGTHAEIIELSAPRFAGMSFLFPKHDVAPANDNPHALSITSAEMLEKSGKLKQRASVGRKIKSLFDVADWTPVVGALPQGPDAPPGPPPFLFGVAGRLR